MSDNKFISRLKGTEATKSVVEIKNDKLIAPLANVPHSTDVVGGIIDDKDTSVVVAKSAQNWKLNGGSLTVASSLTGDGNDYTGEYNVSGAGLWVDAVYTFPTTGDPKRPVAEVFTASTKWVLKLCGKNLLTSSGNTIDFTLLVKIGTSNLMTKTFIVKQGANAFCRKFVIDFSESEQQVIKAQGGANLTVQLLCADSNASATIYNGMTVLSALQRRVDGEAVASDSHTFEDLEVEIADIADDLADHIANKTNPHEVTKAQVGLGNCDNTSDLDKPISTATQTALDGKVSTDGSSTMTGVLKMRATSSFQCAIAPFWDGVGFYKLNSDDSVTLIASIETPDGFVPWVTNTYNIGSSLKKWKNLYLAGSAYIAKINNGYDIAVPVTNSADTLALVNADINPLQQQINHLQTIGRFLSFWDATTGLAQTNPQTSPYVYQTGDYFRVGVVASGSGTNYKPSGSSYTTGVASTVVETERLTVGQVYYYDGTNWALAAGGSVAIDGITIVFDSDDKIQAVGTVNKNTAAGATSTVFDWVGTLAEYQAQNIETLHPDWICYITDDVSGGTSVYTKSQVDNIFATLYPVGSIYIGTQNTCPLTTIIPGSVWTIVATKIVVDNPNNIPVIGSGIALTFYDGTNDSNLSRRDNDATVQFVGNSSTMGNVTTNRGLNDNTTNAYALGLTANPDNSGLIADMSSVSTITTNIWCRTA